MSQVVLRRTEESCQVSPERRVFRRAWLPPSAERIVLLVHGFGEHSGRYEETASWLARHDSAVHAYDQRGHGLSPGPRGHAARFDELLDDLGAFLELVKAEHPGLPVVLLGHSMGGLVVAAFVCERSPGIDLLVTSGAALSISPDLSPTKLALARLLRRLLPRLAMSAGLDPEGLSRDPEVVRRYLDDPLVHGRVTAAFAAGMLDAALRTADSANRIRVPMLLLHGEDDPLCLASGSERFYRQLPDAEAAGSRLRTYPKLRHEIFNEPEREAVYADLQDWIVDRERARGRGARAARAVGMPNDG